MGNLNDILELKEQNVVEVKPTDSISHAAAQLVEHNIGALVGKT